MNRTRSTVWTTGVAVVALSLGLTACAPSEPADTGDLDLSTPAKKEGTITIMTKYGQPEYAPYFEEIAAAYEDENPDVTIDLQQFGDTAYKERLTVLTANGDLPDAYFAIAGVTTTQYAEANLAADLSSVIAPGTEWGDTFSAAAINAYTTDGKIYGVPLTVDAKFLAYNTEAFAAAGLSEVPDTFEGLLTACSALREAGYVPLGFGNAVGWPALHYLTQLNAYNVPKDVLDADYSLSSAAFDDPGYVAALEQFQELLATCADGASNGVTHEMQIPDFINGKTAMYYTNAVDLAGFTPLRGAPEEFQDSWDIVGLPAPADATGDGTALAGAPEGFLVNPAGSNPALTVDFLRFLTEKTNAQKMTDEIGFASPVVGSAEVASVFPQLQKAIETIGDTEDFAIWIDTVTYPGVFEAYDVGLQGLVDGSTGPDEVMASVQEAAATAKNKRG